MEGSIPTNSDRASVAQNQHPIAPPSKAGFQNSDAAGRGVLANNRFLEGTKHSKGSTLSQTHTLKPTTTSVPKDLSIQKGTMLSASSVQHGGEDTNSAGDRRVPAKSTNGMHPKVRPQASITAEGQSLKFLHRLPETISTVGGGAHAVSSQASHHRSYDEGI